MTKEKYTIEEKLNFVRICDLLIDDTIDDINKSISKKKNHLCFTRLENEQIEKEYEKQLKIKQKYETTRKKIIKDLSKEIDFKNYIKDLKN